MKATVLDASALLAMLFGEPGVEEMRALFHRAAAADRPVLISAVNWAETLYRVSGRQGETGLQSVRLLVAHGALQVVPVDAELAELAAAYKAAGSLALAEARQAELITADREFKAVEKEIRVVWLKNKQPPAP
ncbi:MAG: PIN domain-containing protein [Verrucomicrobia bacterium]|nr:PIN domain-containing protein [Verrucomicrobiota bacterium]